MQQAPSAKTDNPPPALPGRLFPRWLRNPAGMVVILSALVSVYCALLLALDLGRPYGGFASYSDPGSSWGKLRVETPAWWPIYALTRDIEANLLEYRMETIDGLPFTWAARDTFARVAAEGGGQVVISGHLAGAPLSLDVPLVTFDLAAYTDLALPVAITSLVFLLLAVEVLRARPDSPLNRSFAIITSLIVVHRWSSASTIWLDERLNALLAIVAGLIAAAYIGWGTVDFASLYPTPLDSPRRWLQTTFLVASSITAAMMVVIRLLWPPVLLDALRQPLLVVVVDFAILLYLLALLFLFGRLAWSWRNERVTRRQRRASGIVLLGLVIASPVLFLLAVTSMEPIISVPDFFLGGLDLRYLFLAIPISFAYVIVRYQAFQAPSRLFVFVIVVSISAMIAAIAAWVWSLTQPPGIPPMRPPFARLFAVALAAGGFWTIASAGRGWFGRFWNWERHSYDAARAFGRRVMGDTDLRRLPQTIAEALVDELELEQAAVWLWAPAMPGAAPNGQGNALPPAGAYELRACAGPAPDDLLQRLETPAGFVPLAAARRIALNETESSKLRPLFEQGFEVVAPLAAGGLPIGLLGLGRRWDEEIFDDRDLAVADLVGQQATLFILAAQQVEELRQVPVRLAEAQERERLSLARELHDTTQQFLGRLPFYLAISRAMIYKEPDRAAEMLDSSMDDAEQAARVLRSIRVNLAPNMLETSLVRPLQGLISHVQQRSGLTLQLLAPDELDQHTTTDTRHVLYRVIQQALDNAVLHADASEIWVVLASGDGRVNFRVSDNGRGIDPARLEAAVSRGSFGFVSMKTRIESVGGEFTLESAPGRGTTIGGWVPSAG